MVYRDMRTPLRNQVTAMAFIFAALAAYGEPIVVDRNLAQYDAIQIAPHPTGGFGVVYTRMSSTNDGREVRYARVSSGTTTTTRVSACLAERFYGQVQEVVPVAIAFDPTSGRPAVTYSSTNQALVFAELDEHGAWQRETAASPDRTDSGSLAFDPRTSEAAIVRNSTGDYNLYYTPRSSSVWVNQLISYDDARYECLRFHPSNGMRGISYQTLGWSDHPSRLCYTGPEGAFTYVNSIDAGPGSELFRNGNSLAYDSDGDPHITYFASNSLKHAWWDSGVWSIEVVETGVTGWHTSLVPSTNGELYVSYAPDSPDWWWWPEPMEIKLAHFANGQWTTTALAAGPGISTWTSVALDSKGEPVVACIVGGDALLIRDAYPPLRQMDDPTPTEIDDFIRHSGVNLPWVNYGHDIGANPYGAHDGFSDNRAALEADFAYMKENYVKMCRVFIFCDFRGGLTYTNGVVEGLDAYVRPDMQALLEVARTNDIALIPVLMDYTLADGILTERGKTVGERPELITNEVSRAALFDNALRPFLAEFGTNESIYAWDIMNEPSLATNATATEVRLFVEACADLITNTVSGARVCFGHFDRKNLREYGGKKCNLAQVHHYDYMESTGFPYPYRFYDRPAVTVSRVPVIVGEVQPTYVAEKLTSAAAHRYTGLLFWSLNANDGYSFRGVADTYKEWVRSHYELSASEVAITDGMIQLRFSPTYGDQSYELQSSVGLVAPDWTHVTNFTGSAGTNQTEVEIPSPVGPQLFYRTLTTP